MPKHHTENTLKRQSRDIFGKCDEIPKLCYTGKRLCWNDFRTWASTCINFWDEKWFTCFGSTTNTTTSNLAHISQINGRACSSCSVPYVVTPSPQLRRRVSGTAHGFIQRHCSLPRSARRREWCNAHPHNNNNLLIYSPTNMQWEPGATIWSPSSVPRPSPTIRPASFHSSLISIPRCVLFYLYSTTRTPNAKARRSSTETEFSIHCLSKTWWALCNVRTRYPQFDACFLYQNCWNMHLVDCASQKEKPLLDAQVASRTIPSEMMKLKSLYYQIHAVHFPLLHYWRNFLCQKSWRFMSLSILGPQVSGSVSGLRSEYANPSSALASDLSVKKGFRSGLI